VGMGTAKSSDTKPLLNNFCWAIPSGVRLYSIAVFLSAFFTFSEAGRSLLEQDWEQKGPLFLCFTWHFGQTFSLYIFGILRYPWPDWFLPILFTTYTQSYTQGFSSITGISMSFHSPLFTSVSSKNNHLLFVFT
jgi:hypothetical protein